MTEGDEVKAEETGEKSEQEETKAFGTLKTSLVSKVNLLYLGDRSCIIVRCNDSRGDFESQSDNQTSWNAE